MRKDSILQNYYYSKLPKADEGLEYKGSSIVDYLATKGYSGKKAFRKELADQYGIENYDFSASKNLELLNKIRENEEILKKIQPSFAPISVEKMVQMEKEASLPKETKPRTPKNLPNKSAVDLNALDARLNLAMMSFNPNTSAAITPLQSRMKWTPKPSTARETPKEVVQQPKGMAPAALEMMLQLPKTKFTQPQLMPGNVFQGMNMSIPSTQQSAQGVDNGFRAPYNPSSENKPLYPLFPQFGNTSGYTNNTSAPSYLDVNYFDILKQDYENVKDAGKKIYNFGKEKAEDLYEFGKDKVEDTYKFVNDKRQQGLNWLDRTYYKIFGDPVQISTIPESKVKVPEKPKIDSSKTTQEPVIPNFIDKPVVEGTPAWDSKNVYHAASIVDLNRVKLGIRNRGDRNPVKSSGWLFGAVDDENNLKRVQNALTDKLDPNQFYGGIDSKGKFELKKGKDFQNKDYKVLPFRVIQNTEGLSRDKKGNYKTIDASKNAAGHVSPIFEGNEGIGSAGLLINPYKKGAYDSYSNIDGGHVIVTTPDFKQKILLSGSVNEIDKQIKNFKKHYNVQKVNIVVPDNGSFSRTYMKKDGQMTEKDWDILDNRNEAGGLGFYLEGQGYKYGGLVKYQDRGEVIFPKYTMPRAGGESISTGVTSLQRLPETERQINVAKKIAKQPQIKQGRKSTPAEEARSRRLKENYVAQHPYATLDEQGNITRKQWDRNTEGLADSYTTAAGIDKGLEHAEGALEVVGALEGAGALGSLARKAIVKSTQSGLLSNAHRINPLAGTFAGESKLPSWLQLNKLDDVDAYWRLTKDPEKFGIYEGAYFNKGVPLTGDLANTFEYGSRPWMHRYSGLGFNPETGKMNKFLGDDYLFKVTDPSKMEPHLKFPEPHLKFFKSTEAMTPSSPGVTQFKKDWLTGWKEVPKPTSKTSAGSLYLEPVPEHFRGPDAHTIKLGNNKIGAFDLEKDGDNWVIGNVTLGKEYRGKGLGKESFIMANELLKNKGEGLLHSSGIFHGEDAKNVWKSLVREGKAEQIGENAWRFKQKEGGMIEDNRGQWAHPGKNTRIRSSNITMQGVPYPVLAKANNGMSTMMQPGQEYYFPGADYVDEFPMKKSKGGWLDKYQ